MNRDEILDAIERCGRRPDTPDPLAGLDLDEIHADMRSAIALADDYLDNGAGDVQYLAEALRDALDRLADSVQRFT